MGRVLVHALIENIGDLIEVERGRLVKENVRAIEVPDALVDNGAWGLSIPKTMLEKLGLNYIKTRRAKTAAGDVDVRIFGTTRLTIQGRDTPMDVTELPDNCPVLIGQIPLEAMDFVVDMKAHKVIGNPAHGGEQVIELY
jgi:predicted aspartyl protease